MFSPRIIAGLLILSFVAVRPVLAAIEDTIVAVVNEEVITLNDLKDYIETRAAQMRLEGTKADDIQKFMNEMAKTGLERLIEDKILLNAANKNEVALNQEDPKGEERRKAEIEDQVDRRLAGIKDQYKSDEDFLKALLDQGVSVTDIRNRIRNQIKTKRLVDQQVRSKIFVNPQDISAYYKNHFEDFKKPERVNLDSIFIPKGNDPAADRTKAQDVLSKLNSGGNFGQLAKEYSKAPAIGIIKRGQALPEIEKIVFNLSVDEVSPVCEVENGFYIFKLIGRIKAELASLEEVKDDIYNQIFQEKFEDKFNQWIMKLKKEAFIDLKKNI